MCSTPILSYPDFDSSAGKFILVVGASGDAMSVVLSQVQDGVEKVIVYSSHSLSKSQQNYAAKQRKLLAIFVFLEDYGHYLLPRKFLIPTPHLF